MNIPTLSACSFTGCLNVRASRGKDLCGSHLYHMKKYGELFPLGTLAKRSTSKVSTCAVSHCELTAASSKIGSLCLGHYQIHHSGRDPNGVILSRVESNCAIGGCTRIARRKGVCEIHHRDIRRGILERPDGVDIKLTPLCSVEGCDRRSESYRENSLCMRHSRSGSKGRIGIGANRLSNKCTIAVCINKKKSAIGEYCETHSSRISAGARIDGLCSTDKCGKRVGAKKHCKKCADLVDKFGVAWVGATVPNSVKELVEEYESKELERRKLQKEQRKAERQAKRGVCRANCSNPAKTKSGLCSTHDSSRRYKNLDVETFIRIRMIDKCEVCGRKEGLVIDHDHSCHQGQRMCPNCIRGVLCSQCNSALGQAGDSIEILRGLIAYLERSLRQDGPNIDSVLYGGFG